MNRACVILLVAVWSASSPALAASAGENVARRRAGLRRRRRDGKRQPSSSITYPNEAPKTVAHILGLINKRFYNGQRVHRVLAGFVMQFGDQQTRDMTKEKIGDASRDRRWASRNSRSVRTHVEGPSPWRTTAMRRRRHPVCMSPSPTRAPQHEYVVFGKVISGMDVVDKAEIRRSDRQSNRAREQGRDDAGEIGEPLDHLRRHASGDAARQHLLHVTALATDCARRVVQEQVAS